MSNQQETIIYIDTNIFLRFLIFDEVNPALSKKAKVIVQNIKNGKDSFGDELVAKTNVCVVSELVYVLEGYYELSKEEVIGKIIPLLSLEKLHIYQKALVLSALYIYKEKNVDFEDALSYVLMKDESIKQVYTFDKKHFKRFEGIEVLG